MVLEDFLFFSLYSFSCIASNSTTLKHILIVVPRYALRVQSCNILITCVRPRPLHYLLVWWRRSRLHVIVWIWFLYGNWLGTLYAGVKAYGLNRLRNLHLRRIWHRVGLQRNDVPLPELRVMDRWVLRNSIGWTEGFGVTEGRSRGWTLGWSRNVGGWRRYNLWWWGRGLRCCDVGCCGVGVWIRVVLLVCKITVGYLIGTSERGEWFEGGRWSVYKERLFGVRRFPFLLSLLVLLYSKARTTLTQLWPFSCIDSLDTNFERFALNTILHHCQ